MSLRQLLLIISVFAAVAPTGSLPGGRNCSCDEIPPEDCQNGDCYYDCRVLTCNCKEGWTGDHCHKVCKRNCTKGACYLEDNRESCTCPLGFTPSSNCTQRISTAKSCISCSTMENIEATDVVKKILNTYNYEFCRTNVARQNKTGLKLESCESTSVNGDTKTCGILEGFINGTAFGQTMSLKLFHRGCIAVQSNPRYICQDVANEKLDLQQNLAKVFLPLNTYEIKYFKGRRCLCQSDFCKMSSSSWGLTFHSRLWIVATILSFFFMSQ